MTKYEYPFDPDEQNSTAASVYNLARAGGERVLDVGSGPATVSRTLRTAEGKDVTAVDIDEDALERARAGGVGHVVVADLEDRGWSGRLPDGAWDTIILADVLEHLRDPGALLADITRAKLLAPDGQLIISVPNAAHVALLAELLNGDFRYTTTGILDSTHVRWFTLESVTRLLEEHGFVVTEVCRTLRTLEQTSHRFRLADLTEAARSALGETGLEGRTYQYVLQARRSGAAGRHSQLTTRIDELERQRADDQAAVVDLEGRCREAEGRRDEALMLLAEERAAMLEQLRGGAEAHDAIVAERDRLAAKHRAAANRAKRAEAKVERLRSRRSVRTLDRLGRLYRRARFRGEHRG